MNENQKAFLDGLESLTRETGVAIGGCGCCGSPFLIEAKDTEDERAGYGSNLYEDSFNIKWVAPSDKFTWKRECDRVRHWKKESPQ